MRKAVGAWFNSKRPDELAFQLAKYQARDGWSNRDLLRLAHPRAATPSHDRLFSWAVTGELSAESTLDPALALLVAIDELHKSGDPVAGAELIRRRRIPRECVPTEWLKLPEIWEALLESMPMTAMIRNLATMTRVGLLAPGSATAKLVVERLADRDRLAKARIHPIALLAALLTYKSGHGVRGMGTWRPVDSVVTALDAAFYASFQLVEPCGKRMLLALDVSASMSFGEVGGAPGLTPRIASAAMLLITAATESNHLVIAFTSGESNAVRLPIEPRQRLDDVVKAVSDLPWGGTDCALPMRWAMQHDIDVDTFVVYTDNETWAGGVHPSQALREYRNARGIPAKLVVVGMTSTGFSIADPDDAGMLDVVGFDTSTPPVIADFARA